jgi:peptidoglycan/xylan/chitin deacetylase (PgdA/CDA1 family)
MKLSSADIEREIIQNKKDLEKIVGKSLRFFAYPFGGAKNASREAKLAIKSVGYATAFTIIPSFYTGLEDEYQIGRNSLLIEDDFSLWQNYLSGGYDLAAGLKKIFS